MNEKAQRVKSIFLAATEKESAAERSTYVNDVCAGDDGLQRRVEALLNAHENRRDFLDRPPIALSRPFDTSKSPEGPGTQIDRYKLLELIGEGGFGDVYMAEQQEPVRRKVALKVIKLGMDTRLALASRSTLTVIALGRKWVQSP